METAVATRPNGPVLLEQVVVGGDLGKLSAAERLRYYADVCRSLGLNPLTRPFEYITLNGRLVLYARRDATDQLRRLHGVNLTIAAREKIDDVYVVTARASIGGRSDESIGAVSLGGLKGEALANAMMKAETKAKRRVTLSIVGLGLLDETEVADVAEAQPTTVDHATGEIIPPKQIAAPNTVLPPAPSKDPIPADPVARRKEWAWLVDKALVLSIPTGDPPNTVGEFRERAPRLRQAIAAKEAEIAGDQDALPFADIDETAEAQS